VRLQDTVEVDENKVDIKPVKLEDEAASEYDTKGEEEEDSPRNWSELKDRSITEDEEEHQECVQEPSVLHLELCEAFFLSYALGCLTVSDSDSCHCVGGGCTECQLSLLSLWQLFRQLEPDFPLRYRVYHHYRARGWVVRSGYCFGSDWALYKLGPAQYHATYTVRVEGVDRVCGEVVDMVGVKALSWGDMLAQTRVAVTVKKEPLVARVGVRRDFRDWESPHCLGDMSVQTYRMKRWVVGDHRWNIKPKVPVEMKEIPLSGEGVVDPVIVLD